MKQKPIPGLGAFIESLYTVLPILSIMNFVAIAMVLYTDIRPYLLVHFPWITLWIFLVGLVVVVSLLMVLAYIYLLPSMWIFRGKQMFEHESTVVDKLDEISKRLKKLEKD